MGNAWDWMTAGAVGWVFAVGDEQPRPASVVVPPYRFKAGPSKAAPRWMVKVEYAQGRGKQARTLWVHREVGEFHRTLADALLAQADREEALADKHREAARLLRLRAHIMRDADRKVDDMEAAGAFHAADE